MSARQVIHAVLILVLSGALFTQCGKGKIERSKEFVKEGLTKYKSGDYENAAVALKRALELNPGNAHAHYYLGAVYRDHEKMPDNDDAAIKELRLCIEKDINYIDAYILLSSLLLKQGKFEEVEKVAKAAIKVQDENPDPHYWLAESYYRREMYEEAQNECKRAIRIEPNHGDSRRLLREVTKILEY